MGFIVSLDIHGVIDSDPPFYSYLTKSIIEYGNDLLILTGSRINAKLIDQLKYYDIQWTDLISITDYNINRGVLVTYTDENNPWMEETTWNSTKAIICKEKGVLIHVDDTPEYGIWFKKLKVPTTFLLSNNLCIKETQLILTSMLRSFLIK